MSINEYDDYMYGMRNYNNMMGCGCGCGYDTNMPMNPMMQNNHMNTMPMNNNGIESMYPEIYKLVFPMVVKTCDSIRYMNMGNVFINNNMIEEMTENIYMSINADELNIENTRDKEESKDETRRPPRNNTLRDLIRILLIRELLRRGYNTYPNYGYRPYMY